MQTATPLTMDTVAHAWARSINLPVDFGEDAPLGAQRLVEIHLDGARGAVGLRKAWRDRRAYAVRTLGITDPRAAGRARGWWATWLARRGLAAGDRVYGMQREQLEVELRSDARPFMTHRLLVGTYAWRRAGRRGSANHALALVLEEQRVGSAMLSVRATRVRQATRERNRLRSQLWFDNNKSAVRRTRRRIAKARDEAIARLTRPSTPAV